MRGRAGLLALFAALTVLHTWPLGGDPGGLSRLDNDDTGLNVWVIGWIGHVLLDRPFGLFDAPMFHPEPHTLAYSEHLLIPGLMGAPLLWAGLPVVTVHNLLILAGFALSGWTMSLLVRRWTGSTPGGIAAGMLFAFSAHQLTRLAHLQALHIEFFPVALWAVDEVLTRVQSTRVQSTRVQSTKVQSAKVQSTKVQSTGVQSTGVQSTDVQSTKVQGTKVQSTGVRGALVLAAAFVLQALCSNYSLVFLSGALVVGVAVRAPEWVGPGRGSRMAALAGAGLLSVVVMVPFLWPYYEVSRLEGLTRSLDEVRLYSAGWLDYLATGGRLHYEQWSHRVFEGRTALFPGVTGLALAALALASARPMRDPRVRMMTAIGLAGLALSFGPAMPGYAWLHAHVPLLQGIRAAARWGTLFLMAVAVLAGYGVAVLDRRWKGSPYRTALLVGLLGLITIESLRAPMAFGRFEGIPPIYAALGRDQEAVLAEFPLYFGSSVSENARYLLTATAHYRPLVNGYSGFETQGFRDRAARWRAFPAEAVLDEMRAVGVTRVMLHLDELDRNQVDAASRHPRLTLVADDGERRLYALER